MRRRRKGKAERGNSVSKDPDVQTFVEIQKVVTLSVGNDCKKRKLGIDIEIK